MQAYVWFGLRGTVQKMALVSKYSNLLGLQWLWRNHKRCNSSRQTDRLKKSNVYRCFIGDIISKTTSHIASKTTSHIDSKTTSHMTQRLHLYTVIFVKLYLVICALFRPGRPPKRMTPITTFSSMPSHQNDFFPSLPRSIPFPPPPGSRDLPPFHPFMPFSSQSPQVGVYIVQPIKNTVRINYLFFSVASFVHLFHARSVKNSKILKSVLFLIQRSSF